MRYVLLHFWFFSTLYLAGQVNPILKVNWKSPTTYKLESGELTCEKSKKTKVSLEVDAFTSNETSIEKYLERFKAEYDNLPSDKQDVLFYIHGFGAHRKKYIKINSGTLYSKVLDREGSDIGLLSSLIWEAGMIYVPTIPKSVELGYFYGEVIAKCVNYVHSVNPEADIHLLTHSMGNRVYVGIFNKLREYYDAPVFKEHLMAAPDIEPTIFNEGNGLAEINSISENVTIYRHHLDRVLGSSASFSGEDRLGLTSLTADELSSTKAEITIVDCSYLDDNERLDVGNHNYYYQSPTVRDDIYQTLTQDTASLQNNRTVFKHPRRFFLRFGVME